MIQLLIILIITTGCTNTETSNAKQKASPDPDNSNIQSFNNPQAPNTHSLTEIGQRFEDEDGVVTLEKLVDFQDSGMIGPIKLTINNVKIFNYTPAPHLIDFFHGYTHKEVNFNYIKFGINVHNLSDEIVDFSPISILRTNQGEQKDFTDDFYLQHLYGKLEPKQTKLGEMAFVLEDTDLASLRDITIITSDVFDKNNHSLHGAKEIKIDFSQ